MTAISMQIQIEKKIILNVSNKRLTTNKKYLLHILKLNYIIPSKNVRKNCHLNHFNWKIGILSFLTTYTAYISKYLINGF